MTPRAHPRLQDGWLSALARLPRERWASLPEGLANTWLAMHASLREGHAALQRLGTHWQLKLIDDARFHSQLLQGLRHHLGHLHGHHRLEDTHYFPQFRRTAPELGEGFALLNEDHGDLNARIDALQSLAGQLREAPPGSEAARTVSLQILTALDGMRGMLHEHLDDEEALVIPLIALQHHPEHEAPHE